jgi:heat shock protein HtpX
MWDAIASNQRRSWVLISAMGALLVLLGYSVGLVLEPQTGAGLGVAAALGLWALLLLVAFAGGDGFLLLSAGARKISREDAPQLWNVVEEMTIASGLGKMPDVYVIEDAMPNAFAVGRRKDRAAVAVTSGLLSRLNRDELQGVVAHEIGHIANRDVLFLTLAAVMVGSIVMISDFFLRYLWFGGGHRRTSSKGSKSNAAVLAVGLCLAILAPLAARLLYFACSRRREYLADASGARFTRYPEGLASALEKISQKASPSKDLNRALVPLYIVNPLAAHGGLGLFSTHPPTQKRVAILRGMAGAGYRDYEAAFRRVAGGGRCVGVRTLANSSQPVSIRAASAPEKPAEDAVARARGVADLLGRLGGFLAMHCACGVGIKVPPDSKRESVRCPRCGRENVAPMAQEVAAELAASAAAGATLPAPASELSAPLVFRRRGGVWESFRCTCGRVVQLSPSHRLPAFRCARCRRSIEVVEDAQPAGEVLRSS